MKAAVWTNYGPPEVIQIKEVIKPVPKRHEVLIKVKASSVTMGDCEMRKLDLPMGLGLPMRFYTGLSQPKRVTILGQDFSGEIEAVGNEVDRFKIGDNVFGNTGFSFGAYAEYLCLPQHLENGIIGHKSNQMSHAEAAAVPLGGINALYFLKQADIRPGNKVLINGAGGSIGTFAVQIAKYYGAEVYAVDSSDKLDMLRSIGADEVIDYTHQDFSKGGERFDVIFDVVGKATYTACLHALKKEGILLFGNPTISSNIRKIWSRKKVISGTADFRIKNLTNLIELFEMGYIKPVIDRTFPLDEIVEAHRYVDHGHKKGNVVIRNTA